jgi:hypothetical protein
MAVCFFPGDILTVYAITGSVLYFFRNWPGDVILADWKLEDSVNKSGEVVAESGKPLRLGSAKSLIYLAAETGFETPTRGLRFRRSSQQS